MFKRAFVLVLVVSVAAALVACEPQARDTPNGQPQNGETQNGDAGAMQPQRGLMEVEGDRVNAVGELEWIDLEGGFWAVTQGQAAQDEAADVIAVIANWQEYEDQLEPLEGQLVIVTGTRLDGASIRMAGPEIEMESVGAMGQMPEQ